MPPGVGADAAVLRRRRGPTRSISSAPRARTRVGRDPVQRRLELDQLAAGHQQVERGLLQGDADALAHLRRLRRDVVAGDGRASAGRAQQRHEHPHGGRLAGAVGPEEAVDLSRLDLQVDADDGLHAALELALQAHDFDRGGHRPGVYCGRNGYPRA